MCTKGLHDLNEVGLTSDGRCLACRRAYWRQYSHQYERTPRGQLLKHRRSLMRIRDSVQEEIDALDSTLKELFSGDSDQA